MSSLFDKFDSLATRHAEIVNRLGADPFGIEVEKVLSATEVRIDGQTKLHLGSNNYLGLTFEPSLVESAREATHEQGTGTTGSRAANGGLSSHRMLEREITDFFNRRDAILFTTGYQGNLGFIATVAGKEDVILIDADSHASIYDACKLGDATVLRFKHNDPRDLDRRLRRLDPEASKLVVTEGIFSMLGDRAPLAEITEVAKTHGAAIALDEAHSFGVLGARGRGLAEEAGVEKDIDFILGTFSKSAGAIGGFCTSDHEKFDVLRIVARAYLFTASLPPSVVASVSAALRIMRESPEPMLRLRNNFEFLYESLSASGLQLGPEASPIIGIRMPDLESGLAAWKALLDAGVYVNLAAFPAVPGGGCLLRASVNAAHTREQLEFAVETFEACLPSVQPKAKTASG